MDKFKNNFVRLWLFSVITTICFLPCQAAALTDLAFLLDASGSINSNEFTLQQAGYKRAVAELPQNGVYRITIIYFASSASLQLAPTELTYNTIETINNALSIYQSGGGTNLTAGLALTNSTLSETTRAAVFISTDGYPNNSTTAGTEAAKLRDDRQFEVVPIGVGVTSSTKLFLDSIASNPPVETPGNFTEFSDVIVKAVVTTAPTAFLGAADGPYNQSGSMAEPVNTATGNYYYQPLDLSIPSRGVAFQFRRTYNSHDDFNGSLGHGWRHPYQISLTEDLNRYLTIKFGDGHEEFYEDIDGDGAYAAIYAGMHNQITKHADNSYTLRKKSDLSQSSFDETGRFTSLTDKNGNTLTVTYDSSDNLATVTDSVGRVISFTYNTENRITSIIDPANRVITYTYDANGDLVSATDLNGILETYTYDSEHRMLRITNRRSHILIDNIYDAQGRVITQDNGRGMRTAFAYDTPAAGDTSITEGLNQTTIHHHDYRNRLVGETDPLGNRISYSYDSDNNRIAVTDKNENIIEYTYDLNGNVLTKIDPLGNTTSITYDANNHPLTSTDPLGNTTQFEYDANANLARVTDPLGNLFITTYNSFGQVATETDGAGSTTTYSYDTAGNISSILGPEGNTTGFTYDAVGRPLTQIDANGHTTTRSYDNNSNLLSLIDGLGKTTQYSYDANNNLEGETDTLERSTGYTYDENDNLIMITNTLGSITQYTYDDADQKTAVTDARNNTTTFEYDAAGNRTGITNALLHKTTFTFDAAGNLLTSADPLFNTTINSYDANNNLLTKSNPLGHTTTYTYDDLNRQVTKTNANNQTTSFAYDALGNLISVTDPAAGEVQITYDAVGNRLTQQDMRGNTTRYQYDDLRRLVQEETPLTGQYQYTYDGVGNLISKIDPNNDTITYVYDANDRLIAIDYPVSTDISISYDGVGNRIGMIDGLGSYGYGYDELNRLISHSDPFGKIVGYGYDVVGNITSLTYPGNNTVTYQFDALNRMTTVTDWLAGVTGYSYDPAGHLTETINVNGTTSQYSYDNAGRLLAMQNKKSDDTEINSYTYTLDPIANILTEVKNEPLAPVMTEIDRICNYDADDRMLSDGTASYSYDANGNQVSADTNTFTFNEDNRLVQSIVSGVSSSYGYDYDGNRRVRTEDGLITNYVLDINRSLTNVLVETDAGGTISAYNVYGQGLIEQVLPNNTVHTYHYDSRGSTVALSDVNENITDSYVYNAFGTITNSNGNTDHPYRFLGEYGVLDDKNGLTYIRERYFNSNQGRFVNKDTAHGSIVVGQSLNLYAYGLNNPIRLIDISGFSSMESNGIWNSKIWSSDKNHNVYLKAMNDWQNALNQETIWKQHEEYMWGQAVKFAKTIKYSANAIVAVGTAYVGVTNTALQATAHATGYTYGAYAAKGVSVIGKALDSSVFMYDMFKGKKKTSEILGEASGNLLGLALDPVGEAAGKGIPGAIVAGWGEANQGINDFIWSKFDQK